MQYLTKGRPKGFRTALAVAAIATCAAIFLAVLPGIVGPAKYDPTLAVLTVTLVALIWYTFFTFWAATRQEPSYIRIFLNRNGTALEPHIENPTRRPLTAYVTMRVWAGDDEMEQIPFYRAAEQLFLGPEGRFKGSVQAASYFGYVVDEYGERVPTVSELLVMLRARWTDDLKESGDTGSKYYRVRSNSTAVTAVVAQSKIEEIFQAGAGEDDSRAESSLSN